MAMLISELERLHNELNTLKAVEESLVQIAIEDSIGSSKVQEHRNDTLHMKSTSGQLDNALRKIRVKQGELYDAIIAEAIT